MSQHATPAPSGADPAEQSPAGDDHDAAALRARIDELERDLEARESQVQALRQRYETILDGTDGSEARSDPTPGPGVLSRLRSLLT
ncbi:hypothetical protein [Haloarchaeobius sp. HME9146]|uniref:hypothetical protein n=1 Tax=Haloarchaeobius sp. HME9146 TaxID=2978732 RepID=UPI0021C01BC4|nr:hypothetical protein [Haloarchaeobius sp. HME9146]MCT9094918.1 hypothetical protein [Haloarchaeobius sp. HME9146]